MYDDLLGPKKKKSNYNGARHKKLSITYVKKLNFQVDTPTPSGKIYPKHVVEDALNNKLGPNYRNNFFLVAYPPKDPTVVNLANVIGIIQSFKICPNNDILIEIKYTYGNEVFSQFDITWCALGSIDDKGRVQNPLTITQLYLI